MAYRTADGITILDRLEVVRHRPSMYIGPEEPDHSLDRDCSSSWSTVQRTPARHLGR